MVSAVHRQQLSQQPQTVASGSHTATVSGPSTAPPPSPDAEQQPPVAILRLRGAHGGDHRNVQWAEGVVDNEGLNRKKSKVCCIYHRPRAVDESSDDSSSSSSDSDSDSDSPLDDDSDGGLATRSDADSAFRNQSGSRDADRRRPARHRHSPDCPEHSHDHGHDSSDDGGDTSDEHKSRSSGGKWKGKRKGKGYRKPSPNAYEKMPRHDKPFKPSS